MKKVVKNTIKILLGIAVSAILVYLTLRNTDLKRVGEIIARSSIFLVVCGSLIHLASYFLIGLRMRVLLGKGMSVLRLTVTVMTGYLFNVIFFRSGDLLKCYLVKDKYEIPHAAASLVVEKSLDTIIVLFCAVFPLFFFERIPDSIKGVVFVSGVLFFAVLFILVLAIIFKPIENFIVQWLEKIPVIKKAVPFISSFLIKLRDIGKSPYRFFTSFLITVLLWIVYLLFFYFTIRGAGLNHSLWQTVFILGITTLGMNVPSTVGFIGTFHYSFFISSTFCGADNALALAGGIILHFTKIFGHILMGTIGLIIQPLPDMKSIRNVFKKERHVEKN